jgi:hypothetical protein
VCLPLSAGYCRAQACQWAGGSGHSQELGTQRRLAQEALPERSWRPGPVWPEYGKAAVGAGPTWGSGWMSNPASESDWCTHCTVGTFITAAASAPPEAELPIWLSRWRIYWEIPGHRTAAPPESECRQKRGQGPTESERPCRARAGSVRAASLRDWM